MRGATPASNVLYISQTDFNPRAPCGARRYLPRARKPRRNFNPRAPCGARPLHRRSHPLRKTYFNPRAPCGARPHPVYWYGAGTLFQPTRPLRGATNSACQHKKRIRISTHAPLAGRDLRDSLLDEYDVISTHAPLAGRDYYVRKSVRFGFISTHAPLAGRDMVPILFVTSWSYFNPRAPCGARRRARWYTIPKAVFQPTRPLRGATRTAPYLRTSIIRISTHAPLAGRDRSVRFGCGIRIHFNPRAPCGARLESP